MLIRNYCPVRHLIVPTRRHSIVMTSVIFRPTPAGLFVLSFTTHRLGPGTFNPGLVINVFLNITRGYLVVGNFFRHSQVKMIIGKFGIQTTSIWPRSFDGSFGDKVQQPFIWYQHEYNDGTECKIIRCQYNQTLRDRGRTVFISGPWRYT